MTTSSHSSPESTGHINSIVRQMFIATADQNYATARWAFLNKLDVDFFWLGLHALEKYFKAILLLNGKSAKPYSHNIEKLHKAVCELDPMPSFGSLVKPDKVKPVIWHDETVNAFIKRINKQGNPNNRYMYYGYVLRSDDLFKLDQLVWSVRRHCRPFRTIHKAGDGQTKEINWVENSANHWHLNDTNLIEKAVNNKSTDEVRHVLFNQNFAFLPDYDHVEMRARSSGANSPLANCFEHLKADQASATTRQTANDTLKWVLDNIRLARCDCEMVKKALCNHALRTKLEKSEQDP